MLLLLGNDTVILLLLLLLLNVSIVFIAHSFLKTTAATAWTEFVKPTKGVYLVVVVGVQLIVVVGHHELIQQLLPATKTQKLNSLLVSEELSLTSVMLQIK